jgi:xanthine dehydrogenase accessory factor
MDSVDMEVLRSAAAWRRAGHSVTLGTIVKTWGSAPRPVGALVAVRDDGQISGSVSGGCVENEVYGAAREVLAGGASRVLTYGISDDLALEVGRRPWPRPSRRS